MSDFSIRLPYVIYLALGSLLLGVLIAPMFRDVPERQIMRAAEQEMTMEGVTMMHATRDVPTATAPAITMTITKDASDGWNIFLDVENFTFDPTMESDPEATNTGHAHLYVDGTKTARLYSPYFHLADMTPGQHEIIVALSSNDHAYYTVQGNRIEARAMVTQGETVVPGN
jgi:hypothetical protein